MTDKEVSVAPRSLPSVDRALAYHSALAKAVEGYGVVMEDMGRDATLLAAKSAALESELARAQKILETTSRQLGDSQAEARDLRAQLDATKLAWSNMAVDNANLTTEMSTKNAELTAKHSAIQSHLVVNQRLQAHNVSLQKSLEDGDEVRMDLARENDNQKATIDRLTKKLKARKGKVVRGTGGVLPDDP